MARERGGKGVVRKCQMLRNQTRNKSEKGIEGVEGNEVGANGVEEC